MLSLQKYTPQFKNYSQFSTRPNLNSNLLRIQNKREHNSNHEFERLNAISAVRIRLLNLDYSFSKNTQVVLGRGFELINELSESHYVFFHAASRKELTLRILFTELFFQNKSANKLEHQIILRHPHLFDENSKTLEWFKTNLTGQGNAIDDHYRKELISVDCTMNHELNESAIGKLANPTKLNYEAYSKALSDVIFKTFPSKQISAQFIKEFNVIQNSVYCDDDFLKGDSYIACIPKSRFQDLGYLSKAYGVPLNIGNSTEVLEELQHKCEASWDETPQVRLLAKDLIPQNNNDCEIANLVFSDMPDNEYFDLVLKMKILANKYLYITELQE